MTKFSLAQQIEEVQREITLRGRVYPHQVASGKMKQSIADYHMGRMQAVLETLRGIELLREQVEHDRSDREGDDHDRNHMP